MGREFYVCPEKARTTGGRAVHDRLSRARPDLPVLFMSAYADSAIVNHGVLEPGAAFIQKHFSAGDLARRLRDVLVS